MDYLVYENVCTILLWYVWDKYSWKMCFTQKNASFCLSIEHKWNNYSSLSHSYWLHVGLQDKNEIFLFIYMYYVELACCVFFISGQEWDDNSPLCHHFAHLLFLGMQLCQSWHAGVGRSWCFRPLDGCECHTSDILLA